MALFETTALALDSARRHAGPCRLLRLCVYALRASDERTEPQDEFKAEAVVSKRACECLLDAPLARFSAEVFQRCPIGLTPND